MQSYTPASPHGIFRRETATLGPLAQLEQTMKILMVLTSHDQLGDTGRKTGFWLEEFAAPYFVFRDAGVQLEDPLLRKADSRRSIPRATSRKIKRTR